MHGDYEKQTELDKLRRPTKDLGLSMAKICMHNLPASQCRLYLYETSAQKTVSRMWNDGKEVQSMIALADYFKAYRRWQLVGSNQKMFWRKDLVACKNFHDKGYQNI